MDVSINETVGLPADTDLPAVFKIDHIRVFEEALVEGFVTPGPDHFASQQAALNTAFSTLVFGRPCAG